MAASRLRPEDRLRARRDFLRIYEKGRRVGGRCFSLFYTPGTTERHRLGLTVPKRVGGAVVRNRVKRRLREIFRQNREEMGTAPLDVVINVFDRGAAATSAELKLEFFRAIREARSGRGRPTRPRRGAVAGASARGGRGR